MSDIPATPTSRLLFGLLVFCFSLPLLLFLAERRETIRLETEERYARFFKQVQSTHVSIQNSGSTEEQIETLFRDFQDQAEKTCEGLASQTASATAAIEAVKKLKRRFVTRVRPWLPPCTVFFARKEGPSFQILNSFVVGDPASLPAFLAQRVAQCLPGIRPPLKGRARDLLENDFRRLMHYPFRFEMQEGSRHCRLQVVVGDGGNRGFLWGGSKNTVLIAIFDLNRLDPNLGMRILSGRWKRSNWGVGFVPMTREKTDRPILSQSLRARRRECDELQKRWTEDILGFKARRILGKRLMVGVPVNFGVPWIAIVDAPLPGSSRKGSLGEVVVGAGTLAFLLLGLLFGVDRVVFGRGPRFSVGIILVGAFLGLILVPVMGVRLTVQRGAVEYLKKKKQELATRLHKDLLSIDNGARPMYSDFVQRMRTLSADPAWSRRLLAAHQQNRLDGAVREFRDRALIQEKYWTSPTQAAGAKFVVVVGPKGLQKAIGVGGGAKESQAAEAGFVPTLRNILAKRNPATIEEKTVDSRMSNKMEELKTEEIVELLKATFGREVLISMMNNINNVVSIDFTFMEIEMLFSFGGGKKYKPDFLFHWVWTDELDYSYLNWVLRSFPVKFPDRLEWYASLDLVSSWPARVFGVSSADILPTTWGVKMLGDHVDYSRFSQESIPPPLKESLLHAWISGIGNQMQTRWASQTLLIESIPGRNLSRFFLVGGISTFWLEIREKVGWMLVSLLSLGALLGAVLLAWWGRNQFLRPLSQVLGAVQRIGEGKFETRLDPGRNDEFGSLGTAFNKMARGLEEGKILGRYVSASVKKAVQNSDFDQAAGNGESREVIVLFSGLHGFEEFCRTATPEETFGMLGRHLEAFSHAVARHGGEIDKVIGEKILAVFDLEHFGGGQGAMRAALGVVADVRDQMQRLTSLHPVVGINAGQVIAGILGAQSVRLDHTVIGDPVNLAARLSTLAHITEGSQVVVSGRTLEFAPQNVRFERLPFKRVKGKTQEVEAFLMIDA